MSACKFLDDLAELETAEEFLNYFAIAFDAQIVQVNRLHILQRFHDYLQAAQGAIPEAEEPRKAEYARLLQKAYQDFVESDAITEKVFKVFQKNQQPRENFVPLDQIFR